MHDDETLSDEAQIILTPTGDAAISLRRIADAQEALLELSRKQHEDGAPARRLMLLQLQIVENQLAAQAGAAIVPPGAFPGPRRH